MLLQRSSFRRFSFAALCLLFGQAACATRALHPSFGMRYKETFTTQANARGLHEPTYRGEEAARVVDGYWKHYTSQAGGGGSAMPMSLVAPPSTAGVRPLH